MKRKLPALLLVLVMTVSLAACGESKSETDENKKAVIEENVETVAQNDSEEVELSDALDVENVEVDVNELIAGYTITIRSERS